MNPRHLHPFLLAAGMAFALPPLTTQAFAAKSRGRPDGPGDMPMGLRDGRDGPPEFGCGMGARLKQRSNCPIPGFGPPIPPRRDF